MIQIDLCKDGYLYIIYARNAKIGIFDAQSKGFRISRFKFDRNYKFVEYHWDKSWDSGWDTESKGTVRPYKELFRPRKLNSEVEFLEFMNDYNNKNEEEILNVLKEFIKDDNGLDIDSRMLYLDCLKERGK